MDVIVKVQKVSAMCIKTCYSVNLQQVQSKVLENCCALVHKLVVNPKHGMF